MTDTKLLSQIITDSGYKKGHLASLLGITVTSLWQKTHNVREFKASEIKILCDALGINSARDIKRIFFT